MAVATTKERDWDSWSQKRNWPMIRCGTPVPSPRPGQALLDLVDPQDAGRDPVGRLQGLPEAALGLAEVLAVDGAHVEPVQRQLPLRGDGLRGQRLAAAGDADEQYPARRPQVGGAQVGLEQAAPAPEPVAEVGEPADRVVGGLQRHLLESGQVVEDAVLGLGEDEDVPLVHRALGGDGRHQVDRLALGDAHEELGGAPDVLLAPGDRDVAPVVVEEGGEGRVHLVGVRRLQLEAHPRGAGGRSTPGCR
ncbi:hypothetical protein GCM10020254_12560 [Streptomyces goshikiensis]